MLNRASPCSLLPHGQGGPMDLQAVEKAWQRMLLTPGPDRQEHTSLTQQFSAGVFPLVPLGTPPSHPSHPPTSPSVSQQGRSVSFACVASGLLSVAPCQPSYMHHCPGQSRCQPEQLPYLANFYVLSLMLLLNPCPFFSLSPFPPVYTVYD